MCILGHYCPVALQQIERRELLAVRGYPKVGCARARLPSPLLRAQCRRQVIACTQHRLGSIELAQFHCVVLDDRRLLLVVRGPARVVSASEDLIVPEPSDRPPFGVIRVQ
jgi:hypothetical protein